MSDKINAPGKLEILPPLICYNDIILKIIDQNSEILNIIKNYSIPAAHFTTIIGDKESESSAK